MWEILKKLIGKTSTGGQLAFVAGFAMGCMLGAYQGSKNRQQHWQRALDNAATYMDKLIDPNQKPDPPEGCQSAKARLYDAQRAEGAPTYILDLLQKRLNEICP